MQVRPALPEETAAAAAVVERAFAVMKAEMTETDWRDLVVKIRSGMSNARDNTIVTAWVAADLVGAVVYSGPAAPRGSFPAGAAYIRALGVAPRSQGRGIGRTLVLDCIERARRDGASSLWLYTADANLASRRLYDRLGFRTIGDPTTKYGLPYRTYSLDLQPSRTAAVPSS